jgi:hypothetical protein
MAVDELPRSIVQLALAARHRPGQRPRMIC